MVMRARMDQLRQHFKHAAPVGPGIFEVRARRAGRSHAVLFGLEGRGGRVFVALDAYSPVGKAASRARVAAAQERLVRWRGDVVRAGTGRSVEPSPHRDRGLGR
jgi:hypothetical protein